MTGTRVERTDRRSAKLTMRRVKKIPAVFGDGFLTAFKQEVDVKFRAFWERRGMPVPEKSNHISISRPKDIEFSGATSPLRKPAPVSR